MRWKPDEHDSAGYELAFWTLVGLVIVLALGAAWVIW